MPHAICSASSARRLVVHSGCMAFSKLRPRHSHGITHQMPSLTPAHFSNNIVPSGRGTHRRREEAEDCRILTPPVPFLTACPISQGPPPTHSNGLAERLSRLYWAM